MRSSLLFFLCVGLSVLSALRAAQPAKSNDPAVQMTPFEVNAASVDFAGWIKLSTPNFILYTDAKPKVAAAALREFEMMRWAAQSFLRREAQPRAPAIMVLPSSHSDWRKIASKGNVQWKVAVSAPGGHITDLILAEYDWQDEGTGIVRSSIGRTIIKAMNLEGPFHYLRGMGMIFEAAEFTKDTVAFGRAGGGRTYPLAQEGWLPWGKFFAVDHRSPEYRNWSTIGRYDAQAVMFVQYHLAHAEPVWMERLMKWNAYRVADPEPDEEEFTEIYGLNWKAWQRIMEEYFRGGRYQILSIQVPPAVAVMEPVTLDLPVREMRELFVISQILNQEVPASDAALASLLAKGIKSESLRELLAEACYKKQRPAEGYGLLREAVTAGSSNPAAFSALASDVARVTRWRPTCTQRFGDEVTEVRELCRRALAINPLLLEANHLLAATYAFGPDHGPDNIKAIEEIYRRITGHMRTNDVVVAAGVAHWRAGNTAKAKLIGEKVVESVYTDAGDTEIAEDMLARIAAGAKPW